MNQKVCINFVLIWYSIVNVEDDVTQLFIKYGVTNKEASTVHVVDDIGTFKSTGLKKQVGETIVLGEH